MCTRQILAAAAIAVFSISPALGGEVTMTDASLPYLNGTDGTGGAFTVTTVSGYNGEHGGPGGSANSFSWFCIERNEIITFGSNYYMQISAAAINGDGHTRCRRRSPSGPGPSRRPWGGEPSSGTTGRADR